MSTDKLGLSLMRALKVTRSGAERVTGARCIGGRWAMMVEGREGGLRSGGQDSEGGLRGATQELRGHKGLLSNREGGSLIVLILMSRGVARRVQNWM